MNDSKTTQLKPTSYEGFTFIEEEGGIQAWSMDANGLTVLLCPQGAAPVSTLMVTYKVGSRNERQGETGATHFLEHMMFKGTSRYSKKSGTTIFNALQAQGARVNATTWNDRTNYYELLPSSHLDLAIDIEADRMRNLLLDPAEVESERTVILNEFDRGENEPYRKLYHAVWSTAFEAHTYHHPTIGWRSDIESITPDGLRGYYDRFYWPNNTTISVIGGFDAAQAMASINEKFGSIPRGLDSEVDVVREPKQLGERRTVVRMAGGMPALIVGFKSPAAMDHGMDALHMAGLVLSHGRSSRLQQRMVDGGLATSVSAGASSFRDPGLFTVFVALAPDVDISEAERVLHEELQSLGTDPVSDSELQRAMGKLEAETLYARDGSYSMASQLNEAIAAGDWKLYTRFLEGASRVTADDIMEVARRIFKKDQSTTGIYEPLGTEVG